MYLLEQILQRTELRTYRLQIYILIKGRAGACHAERSEGDSVIGRCVFLVLSYGEATHQEEEPRHTKQNMSHCVGVAWQPLPFDLRKLYLPSLTHAANQDSHPAGLPHPHSCPFPLVYPCLRNHMTPCRLHFCSQMVLHSARGKPRVADKSCSCRTACTLQCNGTLPMAPKTALLRYSGRHSSYASRHHCHNHCASSCCPSDSWLATTQNQSWPLCGWCNGTMPLPCCQLQIVWVSTTTHQEKNSQRAPKKKHKLQTIPPCVAAALQSCRTEQCP